MHYIIESLLEIIEEIIKLNLIPKNIKSEQIIIYNLHNKFKFRNI